MISNIPFNKFRSIQETLSKSKSLTESLEAYQSVSQEYSDFLNEDHSLKYSDYDFFKCPIEERKNFFENVLSEISCLVTDNIRAKTGIVADWTYVFRLLLDDTYAQRDKGLRKVVFAASSTDRPIGDIAFNTWNGLQIIDLDIKDAELVNMLKPILFKELCRYNWFLGICKSASGKGIHVWTKIQPLSVKFEHRKMEYITNFRCKYSYIYFILLKYKDQLGYTQNNVIDFIDMAMCKPQQGIFISSDKEALLNMNFCNLRLDINFERYFDSGVESIDWINDQNLKNIFAKLEWFADDKFEKSNDIRLEDVENLDDIDFSKNKSKHYKYNARWQIANTLTYLYGQDKALAYILKICSGTDKRELQADIKTAALHNKPISQWAVKELNTYHGFNIKIKDEKRNDIIENNIVKMDVNSSETSLSANDVVKIIKPTATDPTAVFTKENNTYEIYIRHDQYLSDKAEEIIANLGHITMLEAGPGTGKTELFKRMNKKILLVLPYTSTIKAKVERAEETADWLYFYGSKRPQMSELLSDKSISMTIDKFANLNLMELDIARYDYIVIDESHLLFTSKYRSVMSPAIQRVANSKSKVVLMTGTPTAEKLFFNNIKHIRIYKEEMRQKDFEINFCLGPSETLLELCKSIAEDIINGRRILFPTNMGNLYVEQVEGVIRKYLNEQHYGRDINTFYYKKSNNGDKSMDDINFNKSIGNNDIIFCTSYLSVGVDIKEKYDFTVYFSNLFIGQDIEQFANRLRESNLNVKMFLPTLDKSGNIINYNTTYGLDLSLNIDDLICIRDIIQSNNDMLQRNRDDNKYNPLLYNLLAANAFIKYDDIECKYFIDETAYKLLIFEEKYKEYGEQIHVLLETMRYYGYDVHPNKLITDKIPEQNIALLEEFLRTCRNVKYNRDTQATFDLLDHINDGNIDIYKDLLRGNYEIFKSEDNEFKEIRGENNIYVGSIEIMEKNLPYILSLYKYYNIDNIKSIYEYCTNKKNNKINYSHLKRICSFVRIHSTINNKRMDFPIYKFIIDIRKFAKENPKIEKTKIDNYLVNYAVKYANSIPDLVVEDTKFLESVHDTMKELWKVCVIESSRSQGIINIAPFELLWDRKESLTNIFGNKNTELFFINELMDEKKKDIDELDNFDVEIPELTATAKTSIDNIKQHIEDIVHTGYNYEEYSELDNSNNRFLNKQKNTSRVDNNMINTSTTTGTPTTTQLDLFVNEG